MHSPEPHPDHHRDYHALNEITRGGRQAIEDQAMNAMYDALERGESKEEAEEIYFSFFNKTNHD